MNICNVHPPNVWRKEMQSSLLISEIRQELCKLIMSGRSIDNQIANSFMATELLNFFSVESRCKVLCNWGALVSYSLDTPARDCRECE